MRELLLAHDKRNNEYIQEIISYQLHFCFPQIKEVLFVENGIKVIYEGDLTENRVEKFVNKVIEKFSKLNFKVSKKKIYDSATDKKTKFSEEDKAIFVILGDRLNERLSTYCGANEILEDPVIEVSKGINIYTDSWVFLHDLLDDLIGGYLKLKFQAVELKVPSMISKETIEKSGYFETGSQHLSFLAPISNDPEIYDELSKNKFCNFKGEIDLEKSHRFFRGPQYVLNPALCVHCYPVMEDRTFSRDKTNAFTIRGSCFRDESGNLNNKERLNEFTMREGIFFGTHENLMMIHKVLVDFIIYLGSIFQLDYVIETSNDIFFDENATQQLFSQMVSDNKIECRVYIKSANKSIAVASINKHHSHFSSRFNLKDENGGYINTMCIGFGFDRLILAIRDAIGDDMEKLRHQIRSTHAGLLE